MVQYIVLYAVYTLRSPQNAHHHKHGFLNVYFVSRLYKHGIFVQTDGGSCGYYFIHLPPTYYELYSVYTNDLNSISFPHHVAAEFDHQVENDLVRNSLLNLQNSSPVAIDGTLSPPPKDCGDLITVRRRWLTVVITDQCKPYSHRIVKILYIIMIILVFTILKPYRFVKIRF